MRTPWLAGLVLIGLIQATSAWAVESVRFEPTPPATTPPNFVTERLESTAIHVASVDLNKDSRDERIYRTDQTLCDDEKGCTYIVSARKNKEWIQIGELQGFNLLISDKTTYGVRNILVYNIPHNDFATLTYNWSPKKYQYEPSN